MTLNKTKPQERIGSGLVKLSKMDSGEPEIFISIQGEGVSAGTPCVFIRLASCNLSCNWCDTKYTWDWKNYEYADHVITLHNDDIYSKIEEYKLKHVVITGGEPLVMRDFDQVVEAIDPSKHYIISDTNGWFLDDKKAKHLKSIGVEKIQLSLDSFIEEEHDKFRNKPHSYKKVIYVIFNAATVLLNIIWIDI